MSDDLSRYAPAAVCRVASWIVRLRKMAADDADLNAKIGHLLGPLPFEAELLSGRMADVEAAIVEIGREPDRYEPVNFTRGGWSNMDTLYRKVEAGAPSSAVQSEGLTREVENE